MSVEGPKEETRQLNRHPGSCPFCDNLLHEEWTWESDTTVRSHLVCNSCDENWHAYVILEVVDPDAE